MTSPADALKLFLDPLADSLQTRRAQVVREVAADGKRRGFELPSLPAVAGLIREAAKQLEGNPTLFGRPLCLLVRACAKPFRPSPKRDGDDQLEVRCSAAVLRAVAELLRCGSASVELAAADCLVRYAKVTGYKGEVRLPGDARPSSWTMHHRSLLRACVAPMACEALRQELDQLALADENQDGRIDAEEMASYERGEAADGGAQAAEDGPATPAAATATLAALPPAPRSQEYFLGIVVRLLREMSEHPRGAAQLTRCNAPLLLMRLLGMVSDWTEPVMATCVEALWNMCEHSLAMLSRGTALSISALLRKHRSTNACYVLSNRDAVLTLSQLLATVVEEAAADNHKALRNEMAILATILARTPQPPVVDAAQLPGAISSTAVALADQAQEHSAPRPAMGELMVQTRLLDKALWYAAAADLGLLEDWQRCRWASVAPLDMEFKMVLWEFVVTAVQTEQDAMEEAARVDRATRRKRWKLLGAKGDQAWQRRTGADSAATSPRAGAASAGFGDAPAGQRTLEGTQSEGGVSVGADQQQQQEGGVGGRDEGVEEAGSEGGYEAEVDPRLSNSPAGPCLAEVQRSILLPALLAHIDPTLNSVETAADEASPEDAEMRRHSASYLSSFSPADRRRMQLAALSALRVLAPLCLRGVVQAGGLMCIADFLREQVPPRGSDGLPGKVADHPRLYATLRLIQAICKAWPTGGAAAAEELGTLGCVELALEALQHGTVAAESAARLGGVAATQAKGASSLLSSTRGEVTLTGPGGGAERGAGALRVAGGLGLSSTLTKVTTSTGQLPPRAAHRVPQSTLGASLRGTGTGVSSPLPPVGSAAAGAGSPSRSMTAAFGMGDPENDATGHPSGAVTGEEGATMAEAGGAVPVGLLLEACAAALEALCGGCGVHAAAAGASDSAMAAVGREEAAAASSVQAADAVLAEWLDPKDPLPPSEAQVRAERAPRSAAAATAAAAAAAAAGATADDRRASTDSGRVLGEGSVGSLGGFASGSAALGEGSGEGAAGSIQDSGASVAELQDGLEFNRQAFRRSGAVKVLLAALRELIEAAAEAQVRAGSNDPKARAKDRQAAALGAGGTPSARQAVSLLHTTARGLPSAIEPASALAAVPASNSGSGNAGAGAGAVVGSEEDEGEGDARLVECIVAALWAGAGRNRAGVARIASAGGLDTLMDLLDVCRRSARGVVLGLLADCLRLPATWPHMRGWRSERDGASALGLFLRIWQEEEIRLGVKHGDNDTIVNMERPLEGVARLDGAEENEVDASRTAFDRLRDALRAARMWSKVDAKPGGQGGGRAWRGGGSKASLPRLMEAAGPRADLRTKVFACLQAVGFSSVDRGAMGDLVELPMALRMRLELARRYPQLAACAAWADVQEALLAADPGSVCEPTPEDQKRIEAGLARGLRAAEDALAAQNEVQRQVLTAAAQAEQQYLGGVMSRRQEEEEGAKLSLRGRRLGAAVLTVDERREAKAARAAMLERARQQVGARPFVPDEPDDDDPEDVNDMREVDGPEAMEEDSLGHDQLRGESQAGLMGVGAAVGGEVTMQAPPPRASVRVQEGKE